MIRKKMNKIYKAFHMPFTRLLKKLTGYKEVYTICLKTRDNQYKQLFNENGCWYADPLFQNYKSCDALFLEKYDLHTKKGVIACSCLINGNFESPKTIIEESFHMSFPMTFEWMGYLYMIPETSDDESIRIYECLKFPFEWKMKKRFLINKKIVDSVVLKINEDEISLLASEICLKNALKVRFFKYKINKKWELIEEEVFNEKQNFNYKDRNAGKVISENNKLILPTQESTNIDYGYSINFREIEGENILNDISSIIPKDVYVENIQQDNMIGVHTYTKLNKLEVIDLRYLLK